MFTRATLSILCFTACLSSSAGDYFISNPPDSFSLIIKEECSNNEVTFDLSQNALSATFGKVNMIRGKEMKGKTISANLKDEDKVLIYEYD